MVDTTDNRGPNMKHIMDDIRNTLCNDMMSWDELADRCLELESELQTANERIQVLEETIAARDRECKEEHYEALNSCIKRIKVLEDALIIALDLYREIQGSHKASIGSIQSHYTPQLRVELTDTAANFIRAALEVKP
jgi:predicted  nucleic acid-binding Zn-ribbon protein